MDELKKFYQDEGYRDFTILSDTVYYEPNKKGLVVKIDLEEGNKYKYRNFTWEGNSLYETDVLHQTLNLKIGDVYIK